MADTLTAYPNVTRVASVTAFLLIWEGLGPRIDPLFLTYPSAIVEAFREMWRSGEVQARMLESMVPFGIGMAISIVVGILIGFDGTVRSHRYLIDPFVNALNAIPRGARAVDHAVVRPGTPAKIVIIVPVAIFQSSSTPTQACATCAAGCSKSVAHMPRRFAGLQLMCCRRPCLSSWPASGLPWASA